MNKKTLHLMLKLNTEGLDTQMALQYASLLTGMKISNLLTVGYSKRAAVLGLFEETAAPCCIPYGSSEKVTFPLYIRLALETYLSWPEVKVLMERFDYRGWDLEEALSFVSIKYEERMENCTGFPHEVGLLLGYSTRDVTGFIENNGRNSLYIRYWKIYSDLSKCKCTSQSYNHARGHTIHMVSRGMKIDATLGIHSLNQYKSMTI